MHEATDYMHHFSGAARRLVGPADRQRPREASRQNGDTGAHQMYGMPRCVLYLPTSEEVEETEGRERGGSGWVLGPET